MIKSHLYLPEKPRMHPSNFHQADYDFLALIKAYPRLAPFVTSTNNQHKTIDFHDPNAVLALNSALLSHHYKIENWEIPPKYLCPPIPGRADYLHHLHDLLGASTTKHPLRGLDIGTGANFIYPLLGAQLFGWHMTGVDIDKIAFDSATNNKHNNPQLGALLALRFQDNPGAIFNGIINPNERFDFTMCNPPFHASAEAARKASQRKLRNLNQQDGGSLNFGGMPNELWCNGGELLFIKRMIKESVQFAKQVGYFTTLVSQEAHLAPLEKLLRKRGANMQRINMTLGHKKSRLLVWNFIEKSDEK